MSRVFALGRHGVAAALLLVAGAAFAQAAAQPKTEESQGAAEGLVARAGVR